jgi:peptide/nickel transport system permease protein
MARGSVSQVTPGDRLIAGLLGRALGAALRRWKLQTPGFILGVLLLLAILTLAVIVHPFTADPLLPDPNSTFEAPGAAHIMGTDAFGRDVFARVAAAAQLDLMIAFSVAALAFVAGSLFGAVTGFVGGGVDLVMMRLVDILQSFPAFILAIGITATLGNTVQDVVIAVAAAYTPYFIRIVRGEMLRARESEYACAARCVGNTPLRIMFYHLLPNCLGPAVVQATLCLGWAILDAAGLSYLGLGIRPPTAEWGVLVADGTQYVGQGQWWISVFPGVMIVLAVLGFNLIGDQVGRLLRH